MTQDFTAFKGQTVYDQQGEKIGEFKDVYADISTGSPEWMAVDSGGMLGSKQVLVPGRQVQQREDGIAVPYSKDKVENAPEVDEDEISEEREAEIYEYYGLRQAGLQQPTERYDPQQYRQAESGGQSMTRSEEEMRVGTREAAAGRARLRKWVETEQVSEDVQLRSEKARVERQPLNETVTDAELGEEEVEMQLRREEPVVEKRTVAKEQVSLGKDVDERTERVEGELGRERIEAEGDIEDRGGYQR